MKVVMVGEAYGRHEETCQHPLVGPSGRELTLEMGISKLAPYMSIQCRHCKQLTDFIDGTCQNCRERIWPNEFDLIAHWKRLRQDFGIAVTNVFNTRPPNNDLGNFFTTTAETPMPSWKASKTTGGSHLKKEYFHHVESLWDEIKTLDPNLIVCLGNAACWAILGQTKITTLRGTVAWSSKLNKKALPTFHPAAALRQPPMRVSIIADLTKATRESQFCEIRRPERWLTIPAPIPDGLAEIKSWLAKPTTAHSIDIETLHNQISIIGFARSRSDALVIPFRDANMESGHIVDVGRIAHSIGYSSGEINYWPTADLEFAAWKLAIKAIESNIPKIYQNGIFDMSFFLRMGLHPRRATDDTMLFHHSLYPELPKSLGFLGSIYANEIAWKSMSRAQSLKRDE